nr:hypothetical protein CFP56_70532 [Quercus suber]
MLARWFAILLSQNERRRWLRASTLPAPLFTVPFLRKRSETGAIWISPPPIQRVAPWRRPRYPAVYSPLFSANYSAAPHTDCAPSDTRIVIRGRPHLVMTLTGTWMRNEILHPPPRPSSRRSRTLLCGIHGARTSTHHGQQDRARHIREAAWMIDHAPKGFRLACLRWSTASPTPGQPAKARRVPAHLGDLGV